MQKKNRFHQFSRTGLIAVVLLLLFLCRCMGYAGIQTVKIGLHAIDNKSVCQKKWQPLEDILNITECRFEIVPLNFNEALTAMQDDTVDLLIANPTLFVYVSLKEESVFPIATLARLSPQGETFSELGGVLFCKAPVAGIPRLKDFRGKRLVAASDKSFGGWLTVSRELQKRYGVSATSCFSEVHFAGNPESVIKAVNNGIAELGVVRTGVFEELAKAGELSLDQYYFFNFSDDIAPFICSTPLYPEWAMCSQDYVSNSLIKAILRVLWLIPKDGPLYQSSGIAEFRLPLDYHLTRLCLRDLRIGPYQNFQRRFMPHEKMFWVWYWKWIVTFFLFLILLLLALLIVLRLNRRLIKARDEAFAADKAKSDFLANMSHEIRTPLNAVLGLSDLLLETDLKDQQLDYTQTIHSSSEVLLSIINDILDISKIDANKLALESAEFDLRDCIEASVDVVATGAQEKGLTLICEFDPDMPATVMGDYARLRQVLLNLLSNAVKFTDTGEIIVKTVAEKMAGRICTIVFHICDTGIGMTQEQMSRIFAPFDQADTSTTRRFGGTGLGLSISGKIVSLMDGSLSVESTPGSGSDFIVKIPMLIGNGSSGQYLQANVPVLLDRRALIIDSNWPRTETMAAQLEFWGMTVFAADSKTTAIDIVETEDPFHLIFIDSKLAEVYGDELCLILRSIPQSMNVPLLLFAYKGMAHSGCYDEIIHKPVKLRSLFERLISIAGRGIERTGLSAPEAIPELPVQEGDKNIRILLVDDLLVNLKVAHKMCNRLGYNLVDAVSSGKNALEAVSEKNYDVILMDIQMPDMDGFEATRCILQMCRPVTCPSIVGMTANALLEDRAKCYQAGMSDYVSKPVQLKKLGEVLHKIKRSG
ncbi:MAG: response regulator [Kiritimatiellales bacterium]|nr:response regulator [Kiritimatiellales bacterium]